MIIGKLRAILVSLQMIITVSIVIILMYIFKKHNRKIRRAWGNLQIKIMGIKLDIEGELDQDAELIIMNHQSVLDIVLFEYLHPKNLAWVAKKEIANIPWFGHILKAPDMIIVERESKSSLMKLIKDAKKRIEDKRVIAIFPEGTRSDGSKIGKFKAGTKIIAEKNNLKVQPIVIVGAKKIFDSQKFIQSSGVVKIRILPVIQAEKKTTWYTDTEKKMNDVFNEMISSDI